MIKEYEDKELENLVNELFLKGRLYFSTLHNGLHCTNAMACDVCPFYNNDLKNGCGITRHDVQFKRIYPEYYI